MEGEAGSVRGGSGKMGSVVLGGGTIIVTEDT
jgi:hypothetical protein